MLHTINAKFNVSVGYNYSGSHSDTLGDFAGVGGTQDPAVRLRHRAHAELDSPFVNDSHVNFSRSRIKILSDNSSSTTSPRRWTEFRRQHDPVDFGIPILLSRAFQGFGDPIPSLTRNQTLRFLDTLTHVHKKHTMKFGGEVTAHSAEHGYESESARPICVYRFADERTQRWSAGGGNR